MQVEFSEPCKVHPDDELRLGVSSWDDGEGSEKSIKYTWFDRNGNPARGGEVPIAALPQMFEFAIREGYLTIS